LLRQLGVPPVAPARCTTMHMHAAGGLAYIYAAPPNVPPFLPASLPTCQGLQRRQRPNWQAGCAGEQGGAAAAWAQQLAMHAALLVGDEWKYVVWGRSPLKIFGIEQNLGGLKGSLPRSVVYCHRHLPPKLALRRCASGCTFSRAWKRWGASTALPTSSKLRGSGGCRVRQCRDM